MWLTSSLVYWSSLGVVAYTYAGYPLLIRTLAAIRPHRPTTPTDTDSTEQSVSVVLAAHNEAESIAAKLDNLLSLDYPADKLQIIVVSDGSTDGTDDIVRRYTSSRIVFERNDVAAGKPTALNRGLGRATGDLVLFCDARQRIDKGAVRALVRHFADPKVGAVSGALHLPDQQGPGMYWKYEKQIRAAEGIVDSVVGATGALYAIRRRLFRTLPPDTLLDDVYTPMQIVMQGYRVLFEPDAKVFDVEASVSGEFARKARTLAGNYQVLCQLPSILNPRRNRLWLQYLSHKVARLMCPFALTSLLASNVVLVATLAPGWPMYVTSLMAQLAIYGAALRCVGSPNKAGPFARLSHTFVALNLASLEGLRRFLFGNLTWTGTADVKSVSHELQDPFAPQLGERASAV